MNMQEAINDASVHEIELDGVKRYAIVFSEKKSADLFYEMAWMYLDLSKQ